MVVEEPRDGVGGWSLEDYSWDPKTGVGTYLYDLVTPDGKMSTRVEKAQPYHPSHKGWYTRALR